MVAGMTIFIAGCAAGVITYRKIIMQMLNKHPFTVCDYCQYYRDLQKIFPKEK